jgi:hypothetical protein
MSASGHAPPATLRLDGSAARVRWHSALDLILVAGRWQTRELELRAWRPDGTPDHTAVRSVFGTDSDSAMFDVSIDGDLLVNPARNRSGDIWVLEAASRRF